jgi:hypothetical protein
MPASLFAGTVTNAGWPNTSWYDTLSPDNGGDSGSDYWPPHAQHIGSFRRATPRPIHRLRWYRFRTSPRLSEPRFDGYYS